MERKLRLLPVQVIEADGSVILKRGTKVLKIAGSGATEGAMALMKALLDAESGGISEDHLVGLFPRSAERSVRALVERLVSSGLASVADEHWRDPRHDLSNPPSETELDIFYWNLGQNRKDIADMLSTREVVILGVNWISHQLAQSLERAGVVRPLVVDYPLLRNIRLFDEHGILQGATWQCRSVPLPYDVWEQDQERFSRAELLVACSDFGGRSVLRDWNGLCVEKEVRYLPVLLEEMVGFVGPMVSPGRTACFECFCARYDANSDSAGVRAEMGKHAFDGQRINGFHPSMASILGDIAAMEITKLSGFTSSFWQLGTVIEVNLLIPEVRSRRLLRMPRCSACGAQRRHPAVTHFREARAITENCGS